MISGHSVLENSMLSRASGYPNTTERVSWILRLGILAPGTLGGIGSQKRVDCTRTHKILGNQDEYSCGSWLGAGRGAGPGSPLTQYGTRTRGLARCLSLSHTHTHTHTHNTETHARATISAQPRPRPTTLRYQHRGQRHRPRQARPTPPRLQGRVLCIC